MKFSNVSFNGGLFNGFKVPTFVISLLLSLSLFLTCMQILIITQITAKYDKRTRVRYIYT